MQIEPNENASKRMCTSQFSNHFVMTAVPHSATQRNIGLQRVEASELTLATRFSVRGTDEIPMDRTQTTLGSEFVAEGSWVGSARLELGIIDRRVGRNIDLQVPLVAEARESNTVGYASASAAANNAWSTVSAQLFSTLDALLKVQDEL